MFPYPDANRIGLLEEVATIDLPMGKCFLAAIAVSNGDPALFATEHLSDIQAC